MQYDDCWCFHAKECFIFFCFWSKQNRKLRNAQTKYIRNHYFEYLVNLLTILNMFIMANSCGGQARYKFFFSAFDTNKKKKHTKKIRVWKCATGLKQHIFYWFSFFVFFVLYSFWLMRPLFKILNTFFASNHWNMHACIAWTKHFTVTQNKKFFFGKHRYWIQVNLRNKFHLHFSS